MWQGIRRGCHYGSRTGLNLVQAESSYSSQHALIDLVDGQIGDIDQQQNGVIAFRGGLAHDQRAVAWRNPVLPLDVNDDGMLSPADVLLVINEINRNGSYNFAPLGTRDSRLHFYDVSGDNQLTALDALLVINQLNRRTSDEGESHLTEFHVTPSKPSAADLSAESENSKTDQISSERWDSTTNYQSRVDSIYEQLTHASRLDFTSREMSNDDPLDSECDILEPRWLSTLLIPAERN